MLINNISMTSSVDGEGIRTVIWFQGCNHGCEGCHNKHTWDSTKGLKTTPATVAEELNAWANRNKLGQLDITLSGGEPFDQAEQAVELIRLLKPKSLWIYTGYTFEQLMERGCKHTMLLLGLADIVVDGKYEEDTPPTQAFAGSGNQRIIDVKRSGTVAEMTIVDRFLLPDNYVHSSKTRTSDTCPNCQRICTDDEPFERIRRITGYLVGTLDRFNTGKRAEEGDRVKHA